MIARFILLLLILVISCKYKNESEVILNPKYLPAIITSYAAFSAFNEQFQNQITLYNNNYTKLYKKLENSLKKMGYEMPGILGSTNFFFSFQIESKGSKIGFGIDNLNKYNEKNVPFDNIIFVSFPIKYLKEKILIIFSGIAPQRTIIFTLDANLDAKIVYHSFDYNKLDNSNTFIGSIYALEVVGPDHLILYERPNYFISGFDLEHSRAFSLRIEKNIIKIKLEKDPNIGKQ